MTDRPPSSPPIPIIDSDSHWAEPPETWVSRAPAKYRDRVPRLERHPDGYDVWLVDGNETVAGGTFNVDDSGHAELIVTPERSIRPFRVYISVSPLGVAPTFGTALRVLEGSIFR